jgi:hypothetical protein
MTLVELSSRVGGDRGDPVHPGNGHARASTPSSTVLSVGPIPAECDGPGLLNSRCTTLPYLSGAVRVARCRRAWRLCEGRRSSRTRRLSGSFLRRRRRGRPVPVVRHFRVLFPARSSAFHILTFRGYRMSASTASTEPAGRTDAQPGRRARTAVRPRPVNGHTGAERPTSRHTPDAAASPRPLEP